MSKPTIDDLLAESGPQRLSLVPGVGSELAGLASEVRPPIRGRRCFWKRKRFVFPAATFLILATSGDESAQLKTRPI